ncbi:ATP-binding protein [Streptomyces sp. NBC_01465]|uniref:ATP-binding protein n=1 Tax=Streptomyces sp. NBC_01465 TaxID=2903878 RepID=UPI002E370AFA|nr:ATP-binding protein [Streptomyces sp. NBC_01465]
MSPAQGTAQADVQGMVLTSCRTGRPRVLLVQGGPGCGKTALLDLVAERARTAGAQVLTAGAGRPGEPWGVIRELTAGRPDFARSRTLQEDSACHPDSAAAAFRADLRALAATGPVVLCVDDVQRADPASVRHLRNLARHMPFAPIVMVLTAPAHGTREEDLLTEKVLRRPHVHRLRLSLLTSEDVERTLEAETAAHGPDLRRTAARLHRLSGGNPLLLRALIEENAVLQQPACDGLFARAVTDCLRRSGPEAVATARALAVLGDHPIGGNLVDGLVDGGTPEVLTGLAALRECGLLDGLVRREPAVRAAALGDSDVPTRARLRLRAAHALRAAQASPAAVAAPLLALVADGAHGGLRTTDRELLADTARDLFEEAHVLRERGQAARGVSLLQAARRLAPRATLVSTAWSVSSS